MDILALIRRKCPKSGIDIFSTAGRSLTKDRIKDLKRIGNIVITLHMVSMDYSFTKMMMSSESADLLRRIHLLSDPAANVNLMVSFVAMPHKLGWSRLEKDLLELEKVHPVAILLFLYSYSDYSKTENKLTPGESEKIFSEFREFSKQISTKLKIKVISVPSLNEDKYFINNYYSQIVKIVKQNPPRKYLALLSEAAFFVAHKYLNSINNLKAKVVKNMTFGGNIIVADLLCCEDYIRAAMGEKADVLLIPSGPFNELGQDLVGKHWTYIAERTKRRIQIISPFRSFDEELANDPLLRAGLSKSTLEKPKGNFYRK